MEAVLDRRMFLKLSAAGAAVAVVSVPNLGCSTAWISTVVADLPVVVNITESILAIISQFLGNGSLGGLNAATIANAVNVLSAALTVLQDAVAAYQTAQTSGALNDVIAAIKAAQAGVAKVVSALVSAGVAVSSTLQMVITAAMGTAATILSAIEALIPGAAPAAVTRLSQATVAASKVSVPNSDSLRFGYNSVLRMHGLEAHAI